MSVTKWTGREVRALRTEALRITQREFAERLGFSEAVVRKWEAAERQSLSFGSLQTPWTPSIGVSTTTKPLASTKRCRHVRPLRQTLRQLPYKYAFLICGKPSTLTTPLADRARHLTRRIVQDCATNALKSPAHSSSCWCVPNSNARSRYVLFSSHEVSGTSTHA